MKFILGKKIEMTQIFEGDSIVPVTVIEAGPCFVTQIKNNETDGYESVQIGYEKLKEKYIGKSRKSNPYHYSREARGKTDLKIGDEINVSIFEVGDEVEVSGKSKGKGFQGAVKRWGFKGRNRTHGVKHEHRTLGSVGQTGPARVFPGKKMPGRMGFDRTTIKGVRIMGINKDDDILVLKGSIPGPRGTILEIKI